MTKLTEVWQVVTTLHDASVTLILGKWRNELFSPTSLIILVITFSLGSLKYRKGSLMPYTDFNTAQAWRNSGPSQDSLTSSATLCKALAFLSPHWTRSYVKGKCRLLTDYPTTKYQPWRHWKRNCWSPQCWLFHVCKVTIRLTPTHRQAYWMFPSAETTWWYQQTN